MKVKPTIEIWVPNNTPEALIEKICSQYNDTGYLVVIFRSGRDDLVALTQHLLSTNI